MIENNRIKKAVNTIVLSDDAKERIISGCETDNVRTYVAPRRVLWTIATAVMLLIALTVGTLAVAGVFRTAPGENRSHVGTDTDNIDFEIIDMQSDECEIVSDDGNYIFRCNSVTGGEEKVYFDCTLTKKDGGIITELSSDGTELPFVRFGSNVILTNGEECTAYFAILSDSTETEFHLEGFVLKTKHYTEGEDYEVYQNNKFYSAEELKELFDGAILTPGMIGANTVNTKPIVLSNALIAGLSSSEPGDAVPNNDDVIIYGDDGETYQRYDVECALDAGSMNVPFSEDGSVTVTNFAFGPYHYQRADHSYISVLYINLKGFDGDETHFDFYSSDGTKLSYNAVLTGAPAPGIKTFAVYDTRIEDMTIAQLAKVSEISAVRHSSDLLCSFSDSIRVSADFKNAVVDKTFDPVTIPQENGSIVLNSAHLTNTLITLSGYCTANGYLDIALDGAFVVTVSGDTVMLGTKNGVGTSADGATFSISWQCATVIDPEKISEIHIGDTVINIK